MASVSLMGFHSLNQLYFYFLVMCDKTIENVVLPTSDNRISSLFEHPHSWPHEIG